MADAKRDQNNVTTLLAVSSVDGVTPVTLYANPVTHRLLVDLAGGGSGTVQTISIASANGFAGTSDGDPNNPTLTISTTITGILQGNGTAISAASTTGSGAVVLATSPTLVTPALGTPSAIVLTNATGLPVATGISGLGTGVATALAVSVGSAGAFVVNGGALGTPSSGTLTNATGLPVSTGVSGLGTGVAAALAINTGSAGAVVLFNGALGTPSSGTLTNATGLPISTGVSGLGTNVATALAVNVGTAGAFVVNGGALGTPSSGTLTNATGLPISTGVSGLGTGIATFLATPSSANLAAALTDETGSGSAVFATSPTITTPTLSGGYYLDGTPDSDDTWNGPSTNSFNAGATIAQWEAVYLDSSSTWQLTDADAAATAGTVMVALATAAGTASNALRVVLPGSFVRNDAWTWTVGGPIYLSTTAGALTQTAPSATDDVVRIVGYAMNADVIFWNPSNDFITIV